MSTAIATTPNALEGLVRTPIVDVDDFSQRLRAFSSQQVHLLSPFTTLSGLAPQHIVQPVMVFLDPDPKAEDVYGPKDKNGNHVIAWLDANEVAPTHKGLLKIADAFGARVSLEWLHLMIRPRLANYWHVNAIVRYRDIDGTMQERPGSQEWDLTDGSARLKGWGPNQISEGRKSGLRQCESRAMNAALRNCGGGVRQKFTRQELDKPFVVFRVIYKPNMSDPVAHRMFHERAMEGISALYPRSRRELQESVDVGTGEVFDTEPVRTPAPVQANRPQPATAVPAAPIQSDAPPSANAVRIASVTEATGKTKDGKPWLRFDVTDSNGTVASTFKEPLAKAARAFVAAQSWVDMITERKQVGGRDVVALLEIAPAIVSDEDGPSDGELY